MIDAQPAKFTVLGVQHLVDAGVRVPSGRVGGFQSYAEQGADDFEQSVEHPGFSEIGAQFFVGIGVAAFAQTFVGGVAMAHRQTNGNMNQVKAILSAVYEGAQLPMDTAIRVESKYFAKVVADPQAGNMIRSLFVSKQAAEKGTRSPSGPWPAILPRPRRPSW